MTGEQPREASQFRMIDVGEKAITRRRAIASGEIQMAPETLERIAARSMPKGDVLALAEVAGIMAAKRTSEILPLCHPLGLDSVRVSCEVRRPDRVRVSCEAITSAKTGVEMEALCGVSAALLSIYDLTKGVDPALTISGIHLDLKEGGKSGRWLHPHFPPLAAETPPKGALVPGQEHGQEHGLSGLSAAVLTVSDRCSRGEAEDTSGPAIASTLSLRGAKVEALRVVPDDVEAIRAGVERFAMEQRVDLIVVTGGTGLGPRDVTPEALRPLWTREVPGIGELLRKAGAEHTPFSWLSRSGAGQIVNSLVVYLPGSEKAVREGLAAIEKILPHAVKMIAGGGHEKAPDQEARP